MLAVDKPSGMTSHDVGEPRPAHLRREAHRAHGHFRSTRLGVLPLCVGPATRLDQFLTGHDKSYVVSVVFGAATDTDDCDGEVIRTGVVPDEVFDPFFASVFVGGLVGKSSGCRRCTRPSRWGNQGLRRTRAGARYRSGAARHRGVLRRAFGHQGRRRRRAGPLGHRVQGVEGHLYPRARPRHRP
ncbi:MAG: hypothetical protein ACLTDR_00090 [Adlercreutzia equolifaciens]